jgi:hypothetical protein
MIAQIAFPKNKKIMKQKVIDVKYRKESKSFPDWMKYEVTILNEDGSTSKLPAYGKDLQDALSRVVHDNKVEKLHTKVSKLPLWSWVLMWFVYAGALATYTSLSISNGWVFNIGMVLPIITVTLLNRWSIEQNKDKIGREKR